MPETARPTLLVKVGKAGFGFTAEVEHDFDQAGAVIESDFVFQSAVPRLAEILEISCTKSIG
jgi:hypothetical protein